MPEIMKRVFFEYSISGEVEELRLELPLYNEHFGELLSLEPAAETRRDEYGNVSAVYAFDHMPGQLFVNYACRTIDKKLPLELFVDAAEVLDVYQAPDYENMLEIAKEFVKESTKMADLKGFLRDNYTFPKCEDAAKVAALVAKELGMSVAAVGGHLDYDDGSVRRVTVESRGKTLKFAHEPGHRWTLVCNSRMYDICDPAIIPNGERRFVHQVNVNSSVSTGLSVRGLRPKTDHTAEVYTQVAWER